ncbi:hypothetical protein KR51_00007850 [Rubidibacter lacunae KORDI 51-2]|uniref:Uncharacterized protein n=1 Tax=Rubidibacter lacunae KORDI 51-2 TaxID=582515 RepID=U5DPE2_9CHRO|nr:hypothetical protein [Rubidibacter lacunae]ERN42474.1 hypothetical protein KR51_00007850 [Rubidibacter lacunae KORDI 51-2]
MTALKSTARRPRKKTQRRGYPYWGVLAEITCKLCISGVLAGAAIAALAELVPHHRAQQARLRSVQHEVAVTKYRVDLLREQFDRSFDPEQARRVMQDETGRISPEMRRVIWVESDKVQN